jgi:hypothetical protein
LGRSSEHPAAACVSSTRPVLFAINRLRMCWLVIEADSCFLALSHE